MTYLNAAINILYNSKEPLHYAKIANLALKNGLISKSKKPERTMSSCIIVNINKHGDNSAFRRVKPGIYTLNPNSSFVQQRLNHLNTLKNLHDHMQHIHHLPISRLPKPPLSLGSSNALKNLYTGKAGELLVSSKLLFLDFNVYHPAIDSGVDLIAKKKSHSFDIQVKTAHLRGHRYSFNISKKSLIQHSRSGVFYIFVLRGELSNQLSTQEEFLIFPYSKIEEFRSLGYIKLHKTRDIYTIAILQYDDHLYIDSKHNSVAYHRNNWSLIK